MKRNSILVNAHRVTKSMKLQGLVAGIALFSIGLVGCSGGDEPVAEGGAQGGPQGKAGGPQGKAGGGGVGGAMPAGGATLAAKSTYENIQPIFDKSCIGCHGKKDPKEKLDLTTYESVMKGGEHGPVVFPGDPDRSPLVLFIKGTKTPRMPIGHPPLSDEETALVEGWIKLGAKA